MKGGHNPSPSHPFPSPLSPGERRCEKMGWHAERSEASAFIFLKTNNCRFFAALRMTGIVDFFTPSEGRGVGVRGLSERRPQ
jgi:hypothetical protein